MSDGTGCNHISGGLYGFCCAEIQGDGCQGFYDVNPTNGYLSSIMPAYDNNYNQECVCPTGYTLVLTGTSTTSSEYSYSSSLSHFYSCLKD